MWYRGLLVLVACGACVALTAGWANVALAADAKTHTGKVVSAGSGTLVMTDADGNGEQCHHREYWRTPQSAHHLPDLF